MSSNKWVDHIKAFAKQNGLSYGCALSDPNCSKTYKEKQNATTKTKVESSKPVAKTKSSKPVAKVENSKPVAKTSKTYYIYNPNKTELFKIEETSNNRPRIFRHVIEATATDTNASGQLIKLHKFNRYEREQDNMDLKKILEGGLSFKLKQVDFYKWLAYNTVTKEVNVVNRGEEKSRYM